MSVFEDGQPQNIMVPQENATSTYHNSFWGSVTQSYNSQLQLNSMYSAESALRDQEDSQIDLARQHGVNLAPLYSSTADNAKQGAAWWNTNPYWQMIHPTPGQTAAPFAADNDKAFADLKKRFPQAGFKTYADMFSTVKQNAQTTNAYDNASQPGFMSSIGSFLGGTAAGLNPFARQNSPLSTAVTFVPGLGAGGVAARLASNTILGGAQQAIGGALGINDERQALGLSQTSFGRNFVEGAAGGLAGGILGEAASAALARAIPRFSPVKEAPHFDGTPSEPAAEAATPSPEGTPSPEAAPTVDPTAPEAADLPPNQPAYEAQPYGPSREAIPRIDEDTDAYQAQLDDPFGPAPSEMDRWSSNPELETPEARAAAMRNGADVDELARRIDPQPVTEFQELGARMDEIRQQIEDVRTAQPDASQDVQIMQQRQVAAEAQAQRSQLQEQIAASTGSARTRLQRRLDGLETPEAPDALTSAEQAQHAAASVADLRAQLMEMDERRRDLAPIVSRAYDTARQTVPLRAVAPAPARNLDRRLGEELRARTEQQTEQAMRVTQEALKPAETPESETALSQAGAQVQGDEIRLPSGATVALDDVAEAMRGENGDMETRQTVRDMLNDMNEQHALDEASRVCAI